MAPLHHRFEKARWPKIRFELYYREHAGNLRDAELWEEILGLDSENVVDISQMTQPELEMPDQLPEAESP